MPLESRPAVGVERSVLRGDRRRPASTAASRSRAMLSRFCSGELPEHVLAVGVVDRRGLGLEVRVRVGDVDHPVGDVDGDRGRPASRRSRRSRPTSRSSWRCACLGLAVHVARLTLPFLPLPMPLAAVRRPHSAPSLAGGRAGALRLQGRSGGGCVLLTWELSCGSVVVFDGALAARGLAGYAVADDVRLDEVVPAHSLGTPRARRSGSRRARGPSPRSRRAT